MREGPKPRRDATLEELIAEAPSAPPNDRIAMYRDPIAAFGSAGIDAVEPWLPDSPLNHFAALVIAKAAEYGAKKEAIVALKAAKTDAPDSFQLFLDEQLRRLGVLPKFVVDLPAGSQLSPIYHGSRVHHVVRDHLPQTSTPWGDVYLFECGRFFSGSWVAKAGGLMPSPSVDGCIQCKQALERIEQS